MENKNVNGTGNGRRGSKQASLLRGSGENVRTEEPKQLKLDFPKEVSTEDIGKSIATGDINLKEAMELGFSYFDIIFG